MIYNEAKKIGAGKLPDFIVIDEFGRPSRPHIHIKIDPYTGAIKSCEHTLRPLFDPHSIDLTTSNKE